MTTIRCEAVRDALGPLARGAVPEAEVTILRAHLAGCAECAAARRIVEAIQAAREPAPAGLAQRVSGTLEQAVARSGSASTGRPIRRLPRTIRWTAGAGLAVAATIAVLLAWPERAPDGTATRGLAFDQDSATAGATDPFLDDALFAGDAAPLDARLDDVLAGVDPVAVGLVEPVEAFDTESEALPSLAMDLGSPLGDWPGADGTTAGALMLDDLTYEEMQLLLSEMET